MHGKQTLVSYNEQRREQRRAARPILFFSHLSLSPSLSRLRQHTPTVKSEKETAENERNKRKNGEAARGGGRGWLVLYKTRSAITIATSVMRVQIHLHAV